MPFDLSTAQPVEAPAKPGFDLSSAAPQQSPEERSSAKKAELAAVLGVGGAGGAWALGRLARWAFPGITPNASYLGKLNSVLKKDFGEGVKQMYPRYTAAVRDSGKPVTFADWIASQATRAPETMSLLNKTIDRGGNPNALGVGLAERGEGQKGRVLSDLSSALGIPEKTLSQTEEEFAASKSSSAKKLYGAAFKNKEPLNEQRIYDLFDKYGPIMEGALENAKEAFKYDPSKQIETQTIKALAGPRKDSYRWMLDAKDVPPVLHVGEPKNQLQTVISPNIESLDRMKRALWSLQQRRAKEGAGDVGEIVKARKELTGLLDELGPPEYKEARKQYAGDTAIEEAADVGKNLFKQNPDDLRMQLLRMSPDERTALARGFYGSLQNMNDPKFIREVVSGNPQYARQRDLLSAVFPDTNQLHGFLRNLEGEEAMRAGQKAFSGPGTPEPEAKSMPHIGFGAGAHNLPHGFLFNAVPMPPYDPTNRVFQKGQSMMFGTPNIHPGGATIPSGDKIAQFNSGWPNGPGMLGTRGGATTEAGLPAAVGGLGAASPYLTNFFSPYLSENN